ncbi:MAG: hypothetical protein KAH33_02905 [Candidatus Delongbacteria bacterium]|nr:hypothetical protein [Candidatus Delongbacteria bacterium]
MKNLLLILFALFLISCNSIHSDIVIDTSSHGSINMIKIVGKDMLVLNSTRSSIQKVDGDSLITVVDPEITGRDFVLDFILDGEDVYLSNTYDEIFKYKGNVIVDTFKVFSPDKIAKIGEKLYVTSRVGNGLFYMIDIKTKKVISKSFNKTQNEARFGQISLAVSMDKVYILDNSSRVLTTFDTELKKLKEIQLPVELEYGNMSVINDISYVLGNENNKLSVIIIKNYDYLKIPIDIEISSVDLSTSSIDNSKIYLYDYLRGKIEIKRWNYEE